MEIYYNENNSSASKQKNVATIGFFDGVHLGHQDLIKQVKHEAAKRSYASALITFPIHPQKVLNHRSKVDLLTTKEEKLFLLAEQGVDYCFLLDFTSSLSHLTAKEFLIILRDKFSVHTLLIGYDHHFGSNLNDTFNDYRRYGDEVGVEVIQAKPYSQIVDNQEVTVSSSFIRRLVKNGNFEKASQCLGYDYFLFGKVVEGFQLGRKIGFPTANLLLEDDTKLLPSVGVYAVQVEINGEKHMGMLNIGYRPTVSHKSVLSIEVHIINYRADLYNQTLKLYFIQKLRDEIKFESIDDLKKQLIADREGVMRIL